MDLRDYGRFLAALLFVLGLIALVTWLARRFRLGVGAPPGDAAAQSVSLDLGAGGTLTAQLVRLVLLITILSLAPAILVMVTSFTRVVVVLAFVRSALGLQQTPPNAVLISLALVVTAFIMAPTLDGACAASPLLR